MSNKQTTKNAVGVSYVRSGNSLSVRIGSKLYTIDKSHANYEVVMKELRKSNAKRSATKLRKLVSIPKALRSYTSGLISIKNGILTYNGKELHDGLADRILALFKSGQNFKPFVLFLQNLRQNPSKWAVDTVYEFLKSKNMPLTPDGFFIAYKAVQSNYLDWYSGTFVNKPGAKFTVERNEVDDNRLQDCSYGFHCGNIQYISGFHNGEGRVMLVKVNPKNVVSLPSDASGNKIRICEYSVIKEYDGKPINGEIYN